MSRLFFVGCIVGIASMDPSNFAQWFQANLGLLLLAFFLLGCSAFFSGSETALFSLQPLARSQIRDQGIERVDRLLSQPRQTLATLLIGNELANVALSTVTAALILEGLDPTLSWVNILVLTPVLLVLGEVVPKVTALRYGTRIAPLIARPLLFFSFIVTPIRLVLGKFAGWLVHLSGGNETKMDLQEEQLKILIREGHRRGDIEPLEQEMLHGVLAFGDLRLSRLMTPRADVFSLSVSTPWPEILEAVHSNGHSRIPVWQGSPDTVIGILVIKDLLPLLAGIQRGEAEPNSRQIQRLLHPPRFVPTTKRAEDMLQDFRRERLHMALVVEEHGMMVGLVTLDDLLSELVGELLDERDDETQDLVEIQDGLYDVRASMDVNDFYEQFGHEIPVGEYNTVGGFILHLFGEVPNKGQEIQWEDFRFVVKGMDGQRMTDICVYPPSGQKVQVKS